MVVSLSNHAGSTPRLLRETGNSALEADPRIPPNQKKSSLACGCYTSPGTQSLVYNPQLYIDFSNAGHKISEKV